MTALPPAYRGKVLSKTGRFRAKRRTHRRRFTLEMKQNLLDLAEAPGASVARVAQEYGIASSLLFRWRKQRDSDSTRTLTISKTTPEAVAILQKQIGDLERFLGRKTYELGILKEKLAYLEMAQLRRPQPSRFKGSE